MSTVADLQGEIGLDPNPFVQGLHTAQGAWNNFGNSIQSGGQQIGAALQSAAGGMQIFGASLVASFGGAMALSVLAASDLSEAVNKVQVVFGDAAASIQEFAASSATNLGLSQAATLDYAGSLGNMFTSMKLTQGAAAEMSKGILALAADIASFNNIKVTEALDKLKSGLQGEAEPLRSVGVLLSDVAIKAKAAEIGLTGASDKLTEQQKVLLRYLTILDQTKNAQGDFARTATGMANSSRILAAQFEDLTAKIGDKFLGATNLAAGAGVQLLSVINNLPGPILAAGAAVLGVEAALGAAALAIGSMIALLGGPLTLAFIGIAATAAALAIGIAMNWDAITEMTKGMGINWRDAFRLMATTIGMTVDLLSAAVRQIIMAFDVIVSGAKIMVNGVIAAFNALASSMGNVMKAIASGDMIAVAGALTGTFGTMIADVGNAVGENLRGLMGRLATGMIETGKFLGGKTAVAFGVAFEKGVESAKSFDFAALKKQIEDELKKLTGGAAGAGKKAGKGAADAAAKEMLSSVNEMLDTLGVKVKVSKAYWETMTTDMRVALTAQSLIIKQFNEARKTLAIKDALSNPKEIELTIGEYSRLGAEWGKLEAAGIKVKLAIIGVSDALKLSGDSAKQFAQTAGPAIDEFFDRNKKNLEDLTDELKQMAIDSGKAFKAHVEHWFEGGKAAKAWGKVMVDAVKELKDEIKSNLGDGVGSILIAFADKFKISLTKINDWSSGVLDIVGALPGKIGDKLRQVTDTISSWINRIDSLLKGMHKIFNAIPDGLGGVMQSITNLFKKTQSSAVDYANMTQLEIQKAAKTAASGASQAGSAVGGNFSAGFLGALGSITAGVATFFGTRNQGKVVGVLGGAMAGAGTGAGIGFMIGGPVGAGIGAAIGAGAGAILGLFGSGKSKEQKAAEEQAKIRAGLDMQRAAADIMSAQMDGLMKGLEFIKGLETFAQVPAKAVKRFFNQMEMILQLFADMAGRFKAESIEKSKILSEAMGSSFGFLLSGADLINAIKDVASITEENISAFITTTMKIVTAWGEAASQIEMQTAKFTGKISEKLMSSFAFLQVVPDVIKGFAESVKVDDSVIDAVFAMATKFITKMKELSEEQRGMELNRTGASASIFSTIFESAKGMLELFTQLAAYKPLDTAILDTITSDLQKLLAWGDGLQSMVDVGIAKFDTLGAGLSRLGASIRSATSGLSALTGGGSSAGITANIQSQNGASYLSSSNTATAAPTVINHNYYGDVNNNMSFKEIKEILELENAMEELQRRVNDRGSRTGQRAQGYGAY